MSAHRFTEEGRLWPLSPALARALATLVVLLACGRIVATHRVYSQTADEPAHVAAGMEWLDKHRYTIDITHPPLSRIAVALGPFLEGASSPDRENLVEAGNELFHANNRYRHNLASARLGNLPFFILASAVVFYWAGSLFGRTTALGALVLFTTLPPVLAHAGLATTDLAVTACLPLALFCWWRWLERPTAGRGVLLGVSSGLAVLAKFSTLLFFPACATAMLVTSFLSKRSGDVSNSETTRSKSTLRLRSGAMALVTTLLIVWAGYRFSFETLAEAHPDAHKIVEHFAQRFSSAASLPGSIVDGWLIPAPALPMGVAIVQRHNESGHNAYLLGDYRSTGWWYYFPVVLLYKSPLAFLSLMVVGLALAVWRKRVERGSLAVAAGASAILVVCLTSRIDIGVRHILPIYPLLSILAARAAVMMREQSGGVIGRVAVCMLFCWQLGSGVVAHPDYLPYFNELAGNHPDLVLLDSNLDWGQDLMRLKRALKQWRVDELHIAYAGSADLGRHDLPKMHELKRYEPVTGWVAISETHLKDVGSPEDRGRGYEWLKFYNPVARVGRSILLYYIPQR
ncbi:MAG TPA: glycosyltransferase family 39 protein [Thermoanaerobaculia bacterium]|nr:glycosyltransferase family 39 protein [Thermoanaerobaculia bacterium]